MALADCDTTKHTTMIIAWHNNSYHQVSKKRSHQTNGDNLLKF